MSTADTMLAVLKPGTGPQVGIARIPVPAARAGQALVRVSATGICGTDLHILDGEYAHEPPVVPGHEITGVVESVGDRADAGWVGRRVALETYFSTCGRCAMCRDGRGNLCASRRSLGSFENGGFAELVLVPVLNLHAVPDHLGEHDGALLEPLACVAQCLLDPPVVQPGDRVLVTGPGTMGLLTAQVARAGGGIVTVSGLASDEPRLEVARSLGLATSVEEVPEAAFDVVLECSGSAGGARAALRAARRGGRYVQVGIFGREVSLPFDQILYKELVVTSGFASTPRSWSAALRLVEEQAVDLGPLVTRRVPLTDFPDAVAAARRAEGLKTVVVPALRSVSAPGDDGELPPGDDAVNGGVPAAGGPRFRIDTATDFTADAKGRDADTHSPSLRDHHLALWRKPLPDGRLFRLEPVDAPPRYFLRHVSEDGELLLSSDLILGSLRARCPEFYAAMGAEANAQFHHEGQSIGGRIIFPSARIGDGPTINQARGMHPRIRDRFDLTLECIRRHYREEESPLADVLTRYSRFFELFRDFDGYVRFFLLDDLVDAAGRVRFFLPFEGFEQSALPQNMEEYRSFREAQMRFVRSRNARIREA